MNNVIINRGQGGLGRQPLGQDYISGLVFYPSPGTLNALGLTDTKVFKFGGISDAIAAGFNDQHVGEVPASYLGTVNLGSVGDVITIYYNEPDGPVLLGTYTQTLLDTVGTLATNVAAAINTNPNNTGYSAVAGVTTLTITVRPGFGTTPVSANLILEINNVVTTTFLTSIAFTPGIGSQVDVYYYHINRFFTHTPASTLYVGLYNVVSTVWSSPYLYPEVSSIQNFSTGSIRQLGVFVEAAHYAPSMVTAIQAQVNTQIAKNAPMSVLLGADMSIDDVTTNSLASLAGLNSEHVSVIAGQDGGAKGASLFILNGYSITQLGDTLGLLASSQVSDDIAWVATYTLSPDGVENAVPAFATGQLLSGLSDGDINGMDANRYIFGRQFVNDSPNGTFVNDSHCATAYTSDYAYIENNRTFDKASRQLYAAYIEQLAAPLVLNPDGTLSNSTVAYFEGLGEEALSNMAQANPNTGRPELSGFKVFINPAQNVLANSTLIVSVKLQPVGVAREIIINLQFTVSL